MASSKHSPLYNSPDSFDPSSPSTPRSPDSWSRPRQRHEHPPPKPSSALEDLDLFFTVDDDNIHDYVAATHHQHLESRHAAADMTSATPIEISRSSSSPQNRSSNLTSALQQQQQQEQHNFQQTHGQGMHFGDAGDSSSRLPGSRQDSLGFGLNTVSAARPISMKERRESTAAGSFMGGMSWGGMSVGSWIQDEYVHPLTLTASHSS